MDQFIHRPLSPMLLEKADHPPTGDFLFQMKYDGHRCLLSYNGSDVRLFTKEKNDCTLQYPEMQLQFPVKNMVLDCEMISLDESGKPCFDSIMTRFSCRTESSIRHYMKLVPAHLVVFDLIYLNGISYVNRPIEQRLEALDSIIRPSNEISVAPTFSDGEQLFQRVVDLGLEGMCAKMCGTKMELGKRSKNWLKIKNYQFDEVEIAGIRKDKFGWMLTKNGKYVGISEFVPPKERKAFYPIAQQLKVSEDKNWIRIQPLIRCTVKFQCYSKNGLMRSPAVMGFVGI